MLRIIKKLCGAVSAVLFTASAAIYWYLNCYSMHKVQFENIDMSEIEMDILVGIGYPTWKDYLITYFLMLFMLIGVISLWFAVFRERGRGATLGVLSQLFSLAFLALLLKQILDAKSKFLYDRQLFNIAVGLAIAAFLFSTLYSLVVFKDKRLAKQRPRKEVLEQRKKMKIVVLDRCTLTVDDIDFSAIEALGNTVYYDILTDDEIKEKCKDADIILCNKAKITDEIMEACPELEYIGLFATGYNNIDIKAAARRGITVCNAPGYSTDSVAQLVFAYILEKTTSLSRYAESTAAGTWMDSEAFSYFPYPINELKGKYLGIIGYGAIGRQVAKLADAFGMRILVASRTKPRGCPYRICTVDEIFKYSDYVTLHCPLTDKTAKLVNSERIAMMKKGAYLINTSRGGVIDEIALREALDSERIAGAALDVLATEPMAKDCPLYGAKNLTVTPHIAWASHEARVRLIALVASNLAAYQNGAPKNTVTK